MKGKMERGVQSADISQSNDHVVRAEIAIFLEAIDSYPTRAEKDRSLTFQQYLSNFLRSEESRIRSGDKVPRTY